MIAVYQELVQGCVAVLAFALFFLPPGYLLAHASNFNSFRNRSPVEKLLWSVILSIPIAIEICTALGRILPLAVIQSTFIVLAAAALLVLMRTTPMPERAAPRDTATRSVILIVASLCLYFVLISCDLQIGHRLYISSVFTDWSVRISMVSAAMRSGVPPLNGLSAIDGQPTHLRYFYFWYVVCADLAKLIHVPARAALAASCTWAAWALLSVFFLAVKYLLDITRNLRRLCALSLLALAVMGLDLIPTIRLFVIHRLHPLPEIEWWHQDRTPSFLSCTLYAPHHTAAFASCLTGLLVLFLTVRPAQERATWRQLLFATLVSGLCFGVAAGTSILPTVVTAILCCVWAIDLTLQRQWRTLAALALSGIVALLFAHTFLHELQSNSGAVSSDSFMALHWRNADLILSYQKKYAVLRSTHFLINGAVFLIGTLLVNLCDLGFFFFVLVHRLRRDTRRTLLPGERALWAFFLGTSIPYLFLTTQSIASPNDLGVDAGFLLRLILQLWSVPWLYRLWQDRKHHIQPKPGMHSLALRLALSCLALGLFTQAIQIVWERTYFPLIGAQVIPKSLDVFTLDHLPERLYNIREANRTLDQTTPEGSIQYNPIGIMQPALTLYSTHQIAAFDYGCGTGYGGDYTACQAIMPQLITLYGNTAAGFDKGITNNDRQDNAAPSIATAADAQAACRTLHLTALIAESTDSIWSQPTSWVWTMQPIVANSTVRIFACPS